MPSTAEWGLLTTAGVGVAGIAGTLLSGRFERRHDQRMLQNQRRADAYVSALKTMDAFRGAAGRNVVPDGSGYNDEGEPAKDELALNAARLQAFGSRAALDAFTAFERTMWAVYSRHQAADAAAARQKAADEDDPAALWADRAALGNAVDQLTEHVEAFTKIVRRELDAD